MIRKIPYSKIDFEKYLACIRSSSQYKIYAEPEYLNIVTQNKWDCYIYGNYEAVMPIPFKFKYGLKVVAMPVFCQQLGVFGDVSDVIFKAFEAKLHLTTFCQSYQFSDHDSRQFKPHGVLCDNFILNFDNDYDKIFGDYKKDRKKDVRRMSKFDDFQIVDNINLPDYLKHLGNVYPHLSKYYENEITSQLIDYFSRTNRAVFSGIEVGGVLISSFLMVNTGDSFLLLLSSKDVSKEYKGAFAYLIDSFVKKNANTKYLLDFEGSSIKSIADYNKSFGAISQPYTRYRSLIFRCLDFVLQFKSWFSLKK